MLYCSNAMPLYYIEYSHYIHLGDTHVFNKQKQEKDDLITRLRAELTIQNKVYLLVI